MVYISSLPLAAVLRSDKVLEKISNICMKLAKKAFFYWWKYGTLSMYDIGPFSDAFSLHTKQSVNNLKLSKTYVVTTSWLKAMAEW